MVTKWNRPIPKVNWGLFPSSRPNLQQISDLQGQNHLLSSRSCPRGLKKTKSKTRLAVLSPGLRPCGAVDTEQSANCGQCVGRRILGLNIMSFCEEKGSKHQNFHSFRAETYLPVMTLNLMCFQCSFMWWMAWAPYNLPAKSWCKCSRSLQRKWKPRMFLKSGR